MMTFRQQCQRLVEAVPGATACVLMGFDGIPIDTYEGQSHHFDLPTLLTEYSTAAQSVRRAQIDQPNCGALDDLVITTPTLTAILRPLNDEYFLAVLVAPGGLAGKARHLMRMAAPELLHDLLH